MLTEWGVAGGAGGPANAEEPPVRTWSLALAALEQDGHMTRARVGWGVGTIGSRGSWRGESPFWRHWAWRVDEGTGAISREERGCGWGRWPTCGETVHLFV